MTDFGFTADAAVVSRALGQVTRIMERNTTIPILSAALIDVGPDGVFLTGTDLDMETQVIGFLRKMLDAIEGEAECQKTA